MTNDLEAANLVGRLLATEDIKAALLRYCRGIDRCDWGLVRSAYHTDAHDTHGRYSGGVDGFIEWAKARHANVEQSMHMLGNCFIDIHDNVAKVETYCVVFQILNASLVREELAYQAAGDSQQIQTRCRYLDVLRKQDGEWKISRRKVIYESRHVEVGLPLDKGLLTAAHDGSDPSYDVLSWR
jgi:hypothetical protein